MVIFTYNDYLDYIENYKLQKAMEIENKKIKLEKLQKELQKEKNNQTTKEIKEEKIDEIIEFLINQKDEISKFINDFFKTQNWEIIKENLENFNQTENHKNVIYKIKEKEIYFLIIHQKEPNYHIPYTILTQSISFIQNWKKENIINKKPPIIIPLVIYTGKQKWDIKPNNNIRYTSFNENRIDLAYNLVNLNKYKPIELIKKKSLISNIMILKSEISNQSKIKLIEKLKYDATEIDKYLQISELERILLT